jgi:hypothetical protein
MGCNSFGNLPIPIFPSFSSLCVNKLSINVLLICKIIYILIIIYLNIIHPKHRNTGLIALNIDFYPSIPFFLRKNIFSENKNFIK